MSQLRPYRVTHPVLLRPALQPVLGECNNVELLPLMLCEKCRQRQVPAVKCDSSPPHRCRHRRLGWNHHVRYGNLDIRKVITEPFVGIVHWPSCFYQFVARCSYFWLRYWVEAEKSAFIVFLRVVSAWHKVWRTIKMMTINSSWTGFFRSRTVQNIMRYADKWFLSCRRACYSFHTNTAKRGN